MRREHYLWLLTSFFLVAALLGCEMLSKTAPAFPEAGPAAADKASSVAIDKVAAALFPLVVSQGTLAPDQKETELVERVAKRLIEVAKQDKKFGAVAKQFDWRVKVIKDDEMINAFAWPGGKIAVYTGVFKIAKNEAGLAAILGHEMVHALARHAKERIKMDALLAVPITTLSVESLKKKPIDPKLLAVVGALGLGGVYGADLPFVRKHESEADRDGFFLAAQAGYDPEEAISFLSRSMSPKCGGGSKLPEYLSTHPSDETRYKDLRVEMSAALQAYRQAPRPAEVASLPGGHC